MIPKKLSPGDTVRIIAPSCSMSRLRTDKTENAVGLLNEMGLRATFSEHSWETDRFMSSSISSRVKDIHDAFRDDDVKAVMACIGGFNSNQLLPHLDYGLISSHPKIICGYSDITALLNAIYAKTGMITYHAPHLAALGFTEERGYTEKYFADCLMDSKSYEMTPSGSAGSYTVIQEGECEGEIIGGNLCTLNLLQGTPYMPDLSAKVLFIEDDKMDEDTVRAIIKDKVSPAVPVIFGADFGHVFPMASFPIGGKVKISAYKNDAVISIITH